MTAIMSDDDLSVAKCQEVWRNDMTRVRAALDGYAEAIEVHRVIAEELRPGEFGPQIDLAESYFDRQQLIYSTFYNRFGTGDEQLDADGAQVLADGEQIHRWTAATLAEGSGAGR